MPALAGALPLQERRQHPDRCGEGAAGEVGDLHPGHMLLSPDGALCGVLDWTEARVSDPVVDLAMFHGCFGRTALDEMLAAFAAAGGRTWPRLAEHAVERWAFGPVLGAEWALRHDQPDVLAWSKSQLQV